MQPDLTRPRRIPTILGTLAIVVLSVLASLALAELAVRVAAPQPASWLGIYREHPDLPFFALQPNLTASVSTGETHWTAIVDGDGDRVGKSPVASGRCSAIWLGDSFTFGHGVEYEESFVGLVQAATPATRQVNTAVPGYGPVQYRQVLEHRLARGDRFDWVVTALYAGNDFHDCIWEKDVPVRDGVLGDSGDLRSRVKRSSHLYRLLSIAYHRAVPDRDDRIGAVGDELADPNAWRGEFLVTARARLGAELATIARGAKGAGARAAFVIIPTVESLAARARAGASGERDPHLPVAVLRDTLAELGASYLDLSDALAGARGDATFFPIDGHLTPEGNRIAARAILERWSFACEAQASSRAREESLPNRVDVLEGRGF